MSLPRPARRLGLLLAGALALVFVSLVASVALPASDTALQRTSAPRTLDRLAREGQRVYRSQGCWYCHTQQVRPVRSDAGLGEPLAPGDYRGDRPPMLGAERVGPDLTHVGSRYGSAPELVRLLRRPRGAMPSYAHLSRRELEGLAAYLLALK